MRKTKQTKTWREEEENEEEEEAASHEQQPGFSHHLGDTCRKGAEVQASISKNAPLALVDLADASDDTLSAIIQHLDPSDLVSVSLCNRSWCHAAEVAFEARCREKNWRLPRRPRGQDAKTSTPWKRLYRNNSCMRCVNGSGEFRVCRDCAGGYVRVFSLCKRCAGDPEAVTRLQAWGLWIDFQGVTGKILPGLKLKPGNAKERSSGEVLDRGIRGCV